MFLREPLVFGKPPWWLVLGTKFLKLPGVKAICVMGYFPSLLKPCNMFVVVVFVCEEQTDIKKSLFNKNID